MKKNKLLVPGITMLAGLILWLIFIIWHNSVDGLGELSFWIKIIFCFLISILLIYSAIRCRRATGGRKGNTVRTVMLIIMSALTFFLIGIFPALILALAVIIIGVMAIKGTDFVEEQK